MRSEYIDGARDITCEYRAKLPNWIIYSLPDGLWVYSFSAILYLIWGRGFKVITIVPFIVLCVLEILQYLKKISGTFDLTDVLLGLLLYILFTIIFKLYKNEKQI